MKSDIPVFISQNEAAGVLTSAFEHHSRIFVIADINTEKHCLPLLQSWLKIEKVFTVSPGETAKTVDTCIALWKEMLNAGVTRSDFVIGLGGGCITDITGFVSSVFKRGVNFYFFPTTLMAMADASLGGKNGVDFFGFKNMIGTINEPQEVFIYPDFLKTLPKRELVAGYAEIIKHALIADADLWNQLPETFPMKDADIILKRSAQIKLSVVKEDPFDKGQRQILNFGHTIGHAVESFYLKQDNPVLHGEAIAAGMCVEVIMSEINGLTQKEAEDIISRIKKIFHNAIPEIPSAKDLMVYIQSDKKNMADKLNFSLLKRIGDASFNVSVSKEEISNALLKAKEFGL